MLSRLQITNYALIENAEIDFGSGFNTITGETGAGKSILMGALALITGARADSSSVGTNGAKCVVEGTFNVKDYSLKGFFKVHDLDYANETIVRREINAEGKSRAFINDTPVNLSVLKELGEQLVDIHSQHQTLSLADKNYQLAVVDAIANTKALLDEYKQEFSAYKKLKTLLAELLEKQQKSKADFDYINFQLTELDEARLQAGEQETAEQELETLTHAEDIKLNLFKASGLLGDGEQNILTALTEARNALGNIAKYNTQAAELYERLNSALIELKDVQAETETLAESLSVDPERAANLSARLDLIYRLQKKHNVQNLTDLLELYDKLQQQIGNDADLDNQISATEKELQLSEEKCHALAAKLSAQRTKALPVIEGELVKTLGRLNMAGSELHINLTPLDYLSNTGVDDINIQFTANKGSKLGDLVKVASGGELSRVMLAIKALVCKYTALPTIIFDEIDTGISGETAHKTGAIMAEMGKTMQVVAITHLPQIAGKGQTHLKVYKQTKADITKTFIKPLRDRERLEEIARMLSGDKLSEAALENAKELIAGSL
jgi:DNA repair protein RecN (Recombination protein N)